MAKVILTDQALRDSRKIPKIEYKKIIKKLDAMETGSLIGKKLGGDLEKYYSIRAWPYRIIYIIKKNGDMWITHIQHRQRAYKP